jgi:hypothetical protein
MTRASVLDADRERDAFGLGASRSVGKLGRVRHVRLVAWATTRASSGADTAVVAVKVNPGRMRPRPSSRTFPSWESAG